MIKKNLSRIIKEALLFKGRFIIVGNMILSVFLIWSVWRKTNIGFPVIFRGNGLGINLLGGRNAIWEIPFLGILFISINYFFSRYLFKDNKNLKKLLFFVSIGIAFLVLLISIQIYYLNL